jgi:hypothetical protein
MGLEPIKEIVGLRGLVVSTVGTGTKFYSPEDINKIFAPILEERIFNEMMHIIANYDCFAFYLHLTMWVNNDSSTNYRLHQVSQMRYTPMNNAEVAAMDYLSRGPLSHPDRNLVWFRLLASSAGQEYLSDADLLSFFKLRHTEYKAIEPYLIDWVVEKNAQGDLV